MADVGSGSDHVYRVDRFVVPEAARGEFLARVRMTHERLRTLPGFLGDLVLERRPGADGTEFVTIVEWDDIRSIEQAKSAIKAMHAAMDFDPQRMFARLGIEAELGSYRRVDP